MQTVRTTCPYCGVGCGVRVSVESGGEVEVEGDPDHPANFGRLCSKGSALAETLGDEERLLHPEIDGVRAGWDDALDRVASAFSSTIARHGPDSVAIYGSGQLLTEDYYVANKLMKGFIGSANIDTNSRLCMASSVAGHKRAFGSDTVPGNYEDIELADLVVLVGSNLAWCHPVLYQRLSKAKLQRPQMRVVVIDPRRTVTAGIADLHLPINSDGDTALFVGLLNALAANSRSDDDFVRDHTSGATEAAAVAAGWNNARVAEATGLDPSTIATFYDWFASTERTVTVYSQGVNQSASGTDKVNAIINCHLLTGRIGRPGMGPFSVTGQPNAMGGREVGGLANMLAAHMDFTPDAIDRVSRFWGTPHVATKPGHKAVDMFRAVASGEIKAIWILATNPVDSMPDADAVKAALATCPFVVVSDASAHTDTGRLAHVRLPAAAWGEKSGTVTNSERRISRQRPFRRPPGEAMPDWWIICQVAKRMGHRAPFDYGGPADIFAEHAALSAFENNGTRDFDLSGLVDTEYEHLAPVQWPVRASGTARMFADGHFYTPDKRARLIPVEPPPPVTRAADEFILNTGRVRDHWHTMTRTGLSARLSSHYAEPFATIHPSDAAALGIEPATLVRLRGLGATAIVRALVSEGQDRGSVFVPMHWTDQLSANARVDALVAAHIDPVSGQPALKMSRVTAESARPGCYGFFVSVDRPKALDCGYWALARTRGGWRGELAWFGATAEWTDWLRDVFGLEVNQRVDSAGDRRNGRQSFAVVDDGKLVAALFVSPDPVEVARQWAAEMLIAAEVSAAKILAGRPGADTPDAGAIVCACESVGINSVLAAINAGCASLDAIGAATRAGTNCGSCRAEISALLRVPPSLRGKLKPKSCRPDTHAAPRGRR